MLVGLLKKICTCQKLWFLLFQLTHISVNYIHSANYHIIAGFDVGFLGSKKNHSPEMPTLDCTDPSGGPQILCTNFSADMWESLVNCRWRVLVGLMKKICTYTIRNKLDRYGGILFWRMLQVSADNISKENGVIVSPDGMPYLAVM